MASRHFATLEPGNPVAQGTFKYLNAPVSGRQGFSTVFAPRETEDDFLIGRFKPDDFDATDVYNEFVLYKEFGARGFSPKIHSVMSNGKQLSLIKFLTNIRSELDITTHITPNIQFLIEKKECEKLIFNYFKRQNNTIDYAHFFTSLRAFIALIVQYGYYNTDIKIPNLCIDPNTMKFVMIDLDPKFVKNIPDNERNREIMNHYVNYMIYQVYIYLTVASKVIVQFHETGIDTDLNARPNLYAMMEFIYQKNIVNSNLRRDILDPLYMLFWYSSQVDNGEYDTRFRRFNYSSDIANFFDRRVIEGIGKVTLHSPPQKSSWFSSIMGAFGFGKSKKSAKKRKLKILNHRGTVLNLRRYKKKRNSTRRRSR